MLLSRLATLAAWLLWPALVVVLGPMSHWPGSLTATVAWLLVALGPPVLLTHHRAPLPALRRASLIVFLLAFGVAYLAVLLVSRYWHFYHLTVPTNDLFLAVVAWPALTLLNAAGGLFALRAPVRI